MARRSSDHQDSSEVFFSADSEVRGREDTDSSEHTAERNDLSGNQPSPTTRVSNYFQSVRRQTLSEHGIAQPEMVNEAALSVADQTSADFQHISDFLPTPLLSPIALSPPRAARPFDQQQDDTTNLQEQDAFSDARVSAELLSGTVVPELRNRVKASAIERELSNYPLRVAGEADMEIAEEEYCADEEFQTASDRSGTFPEALVHTRYMRQRPFWPSEAEPTLSMSDQEEITIETDVQTGGLAHTSPTGDSDSDSDSGLTPRVGTFRQWEHPAEPGSDRPVLAAAARSNGWSSPEDELITMEDVITVQDEQYC